jgi:outer membrane immunogenic protein
MKRTIAAVFIAATFASLPAAAADLPRAAPTAPAVFVPVFTWTGFYVGANAGYGWGRLTDPTGTFTTNLDGGLAGGQVGYNWQTGNWVFGIEGDIQASWQEESVSGTVAGIGLTTVTGEFPWFATARGRLGYAWDRHLLYVTGGGGWVNVKLSVTGAGATVSSDDTKFAWTIGGGWEWMFMPKWSAKAEYLYMDTGDTNVTLFGVTVSGSGHNHIARLGINYHF